MHALSVKQPYAEWIATGEKKIEYRTWAPRVLVGRDLLIVASRTPGDGYAGEPQGVAICVVRVDAMRGDPGDYEWALSNPRRVEPLEVHGYASLYKVEDALIRYAKLAPHETRASFRKRARRTLDRGPYTFSIGDRDLRGMRAKTPAAARKLARELAAEHGTTITISRDGIAIGGES